MKERELRENAKCRLCGKGILAGGVPLFWRVTIERFGVDMRKCERQQGLTMMLGSAALASVMGPNEDLAMSVMEPVTLTVCEDCAMVKSQPIVCLAEMSVDKTATLTIAPEGSDETEAS